MSPNPLQISQLGSEKLIPDDTDLIPIQQADGITRRISKANLLANYQPIEESSSSTQIIHIQHTASSGGSSGGKQSTQWTARPLNTIKVDQTGEVILNSNTISLPAGTYLFDAFGQFYDCGFLKTRLQDVTNNITIGRGAFNNANWGNTMFTALLRAVFTLTATADIQFQYYQAGGNYDGANNMGVGWSYPGVPEVYADVVITKVG